MVQPLILISRSTTWERLAELIAELQGQTFAVTGKGARARRLIVRLARELPKVEVYGPSQNHEFVAYVNRDSARPIAYRMPG